MEARQAVVLDAAHLRKLQRELLEIYIEFDRICRAANIPYVMSGGTLLGAVRHKGFIPWDDDIDVFMPRPDYDRLMDICARQDMGRYELCTPYNTDNYFMHFSKLCRRDTTIMERVDTPCV